MSNPYQPPTEESHGRSARPWMILSAVLFVAVIFMGVVLLRSVRQAESARARAQAAMRNALINDLKAQGELLHQKEVKAASDNE